MNQSLCRSIIKNGFKNASQEERDCAAWLIANDMASGMTQPDRSRPGNHTRAVARFAPTAKGIDWAKQSNLKDFFNNPWAIGIVTVLLGAFASYFFPKFLG